jgi:hypothetical protein
MAPSWRYPSSSAIIRGKCARKTTVGAERSLLRYLLALLPEGEVLVGSKRVTIQGIADQINAHIDAVTATDHARAVLGDLMKAEAEARRVSRASVIALREYARMMFGDRSQQCDKLGFAPRQVSKRSAAAKVAAIKKSAATRKQRGTTGKRQKAKLNGNAAR